MQAVAHNPSFAKKVGVPVSVGKEYVKADKKQRAPRVAQRTATINKPKTAHGKPGVPNRRK